MLRASHWLLMLGATSCRATLPQPPESAHASDDFVEVPYPPPAALTETVPRRPAYADSVWIDGEWAFRGSVFAWRRGGWFALPLGARFAHWATRYTNEGQLLLAPGAWFDAKGNRIAPPALLAPATTPPNEVTSEYQTGR